MNDDIDKAFENLDYIYEAIDEVAGIVIVKYTDNDSKCCGIIDIELKTSNKLLADIRELLQLVMEILYKNVN